MGNFRDKMLMQSSHFTIGVGVEMPNTREELLQ